MTTVSQSLSGKTARDENFPVASRLIARRRRPIILAFYRFVRAADERRGQPPALGRRKARSGLFDHLADALCGCAHDPEAERLRLALRTQGIAPKHALDLLARSGHRATPQRNVATGVSRSLCPAIRTVHHSL